MRESQPFNQQENNMKALLKRLDYLTQSTPGLLLMATAWDALIVVLLGTLPLKLLVKNTTS